MPGFGTLGVLETLAAIRNQTVAQYGEERTFTAIQLAFAAHDRIMGDLVADMVEFTSDQLRNSGGTATFTAEQLGEYGRAAPQKVSAGATLGFPLRRWGNSLQWTRDWLARKTPAELAAQSTAIMDADRRNLLSRLQAAVFVPTNYSFTDWLVNNISIPVKRLANADSFPIPPDPNGTAFDASTHTHYLARAGASLAGADIDALVATVQEHYASGELFLFIARGDEATIRAFTNFKGYMDARLTVANDVTHAAAPLDVINTYDRAIGIYNGAEVWVKPWIPSGYVVCFISGNGMPLALRTEGGTGTGTLQLVSDIDMYPLRAQEWKREFDVGVANRVAAAVLDTTHQTTYQAPSGL